MLHHLISLGPVFQSSMGENHSSVKCWKSNSIGLRGNVKEGWKLTPMSPFDVEQGGINSGPGGRRVPERVPTDRPGFSLCTTLLESSGP